jgi:anti-sigma factor RsiW
MAAVSCEEIRKLFSARVDDALSGDERTRLDAHMATCAECAREWARFAGTVGLLRAAPPTRAPAGFVDRVLAARPQPWYRRLARGLLTPWPVKLPVEAVAIVLVAGLAIMLFQRSPELQQAARTPTEAPSAPATAPEPREPKAVESAPGGASTRALPEAAAPEKKDLTSPSARPDPATARDAPPAAPTPLTDPVPARPAEESRAKRSDAPALGARKEAVEERVARQSSPAQSELSADLRKAELLARLAVADRAAAERGVADLMARASGRVLARSEDAGAVVLSLVVPEGRWDEVRRGLETLGTLRVEGDRPAGPVHVTIRLER